ncbi:transporter substrate-binding domain-containing protein [Curvibacter sp. APW13]|uniref:transporter substrate-binding domain-containing protein n=1 Tax=Curvibacter sp. APW13 TaxID=3077236 RepID=UPI0028DEE885|nr:transporter substrate-binding domain-containing protein [Curvibacter sp. APW13]MDT8992009.1 transporter substrate-binding domain-containing protein [Curvibacter sp. APW13]
MNSPLPPSRPRARQQPVGTVFHLLSLLVALLLPVLAQAQAQSHTIVYPAQDKGYEYPVQLLDLALHKSGSSFTLKPHDTPMLQGRALKLLAKGQELRVVWSMTSTEREAELLPIRIPIDKGLLGWRVFLVHESQAQRFAHVNTLQDLAAFEAGQGHDWPDTEILRANELPVQAVPGFQNLFPMLEKGRFDYFPRSILEVWGEQQQHADRHLVVEPRVVLHYPTAYYYFVNKADTALAQALERGLRAALKDGSFDALFNKTYGEAIQRARLNQRTRLELRNPLLPARTPLDQKELWLNL